MERSIKVDPVKTIPVMRTGSTGALYSYTSHSLELEFSTDGLHLILMDPDPESSRNGLWVDEGLFVYSVDGWQQLSKSAVAERHPREPRRGGKLYTVFPKAQPLWQDRCAVRRRESDGSSHLDLVDSTGTTLDSFALTYHPESPHRSPEEFFGEIDWLYEEQMQMLTVFTRLGNKHSDHRSGYLLDVSIGMLACLMWREYILDWAFSPDGRLFAVSCGGYNTAASVEIWDVSNLKMRLQSHASLLLQRKRVSVPVEYYPVSAG